MSHRPAPAFHEYQTAHQTAVLFDQSSRGKIEVRGPEAADFLHNLCTNDIKGLPLGAGCEAFFCNERARALAHVFIYHIKPGGRDALWIDVTSGQNEFLLKHLDRHLIAEQVELTDRTDQFAQFHLVGPDAINVLSRALGEPVPELSDLQHMERTFGNQATAHIRRNDLLNLTGFDIVFLPIWRDEVVNRLKGASSIVGGPTAFDWLRMDAGWPIYGEDIDDKRFVLEVNRPRAVSYTKGCYLGQEPIVMSRDRAGHLNRVFRGLRLSGAEAQVGSRLFQGDQEAGVVTSVALSPTFGPIGLGYIKRGYEIPGTDLTVQGTNVSARVSSLPFSANH